MRRYIIKYQKRIMGFMWLEKQVIKHHKVSDSNKKTCYT
jgi:hypothetical protein